MANVCMNNFNFHGPAGSITDLLERATRLSPLTRDDAEALAARLPDPTAGLDGLYETVDWTFTGHAPVDDDTDEVGAWGADRDVAGSGIEPQLVTYPDGTATVSVDIDTRYEPPIAWLLAVSAAHHDVECRVDYDEPGLDAAGTIIARAGQIIVDDYPSPSNADPGEQD